MAGVRARGWRLSGAEHARESEGSTVNEEVSRTRNSVTACVARGPGSVGLAGKGKLMGAFATA
eukprot:3232479-Prymnesium_polylepis.1